MKTKKTCNNIYFILDVWETTGFQTMIRTHPHLLADAYRAMASSQNNIICPPRKKQRTA